MPAHARARAGRRAARISRRVEARVSPTDPTIVRARLRPAVIPWSPTPLGTRRQATSPPTR
eukprot:6239965-Lingulodinium_polyedra.AAC.1